MKYEIIELHVHRYTATETTRFISLFSCPSSAWRIWYQTRRFAVCISSSQFSAHSWIQYKQLVILFIFTIYSVLSGNVNAVKIWSSLPRHDVLRSVVKLQCRVRRDESDLPISFRGEVRIRRNLWKISESVSVRQSRNVNYACEVVRHSK